MVVGHDGLQGASDDFGEKRDKTAMLFNENFPGKNITMTLKKLIKICPLYFSLFVSIIFLLSTTYFSSSNILKPLDNSRVQCIFDGGLAAGLITE